MTRRQAILALVGATLTAACLAPPPVRETPTVPAAATPAPAASTPAPAPPVASPPSQPVPAPAASPRASPAVVVPGRAPSPSPGPSPSPFPIALRRPGSLAVERDGRILAVPPESPGPATTLVSGPDSTAPRWSPDGRSLLFVRGQGPAAELYLLPAAGGPARRLTANRRPERSAAWSPRGDQVAYVLPRSADPRDFDDPAEPEEVWLVDVASGAERKVADGFDPGWSPDGRTIAYATNGQRDAHGPRANAIRALDLASGADRPVLAVSDLPSDFLPAFGLPFKPATVRLRAPSWSPNGRALVASADGHTSMALTFDAGGQGLRPWALAFEGGVGRARWSPDGGRLAVESRPATGVDVVVLVDRASGREAIVGGPAAGFQASQPAWSPDGGRLAAIVAGLPGPADAARQTSLRLYAPDGAEVSSLLVEAGLAAPDWGSAP